MSQSLIQKNILLTNPKDARLRMRNFMQSIYDEQGDVTLEEEHVLSFLRGNGDDAVMEELRKRKLTQEEMLNFEGPISKQEMKEQLFHHMKPASAPGQDGFTVMWVKHFWQDGCYEEMELTSLLRTTIKKILRKGEKCPIVPGNYRPISLLSVFYKIGSGCITSRL